MLINNLKFNGEDGEFDLSSPLSNLFDESEDLNILNNDMMIQSSSTHFQHPRQPSQNYAHCVNGYRQNSYQVSIFFYFLEYLLYDVVYIRNIKGLKKL